MWAFPPRAGVFEDTLVACYRENPEPFIVNLTCQGVQPELQFVDKKLAFDRVLINRSVTVCIIKCARLS